MALFGDGIRRISFWCNFWLGLSHIKFYIYGAFFKFYKVLPCPLLRIQVNCIISNLIPAYITWFGRISMINSLHWFKNTCFRYSCQLFWCSNILCRKLMHERMTLTLPYTSKCSNFKLNKIVFHTENDVERIRR